MLKKKKKPNRLRRTEVKKYSRLNDTEELLSKLEGRVMEITESEQKKEKR